MISHNNKLYFLIFRWYYLNLTCKININFSLFPVLKYNRNSMNWSYLMYKYSIINQVLHNIKKAD